MPKNKMTDKEKLMSNKTTSKIPKTLRQKKMWIQARKLVAKTSGATSEKSMPWGLLTKITKDQEKGNKVIKPSDIKKAKVSKTVKAYKKPDQSKRK